MNICHLSKLRPQSYVIASNYNKILHEQIAAFHCICLNTVERVRVLCGAVLLIPLD